LRQIGTGQTIWWRASRSPAPSIAPWPVPNATTPKTRRPLVKPTRRSRRRLPPALSLTAACLAGAGAFLIVAGSGRAHTAAAALAEIEHMIDVAGYGLTQVSLTGHRLTPDSDIFDAIDLASTPTMLSFDSRAAQIRIESLAWVERASIERIFPDRLEVHITERTPFAVWRRGERHHLIDRSGRVLAGVSPNTVPSLPRLAGEGAPAEAAALLTLLAGHPELARQVELAERVGERRWTLRLAGGGAIELPADGIAAAMSCAAALIGADHEAHTKDIDLRVAGRVLLRTARGDGRIAEQSPGARLATGGI
jgi:cell division protein FtsQ